MNTLDAIILAGGFGTRLRRVLSDRPKVLATVNGRPFLDIVLDFLDRSPLIGRVVIAVGYMAEKVVEAYEGRCDYNFKILFSQERKPLGTGGAIKKALRFTETQDVLALNGDSYVDTDIEDLLRTHRKKKAAMTIVLKEMEETGRYGRAGMDGSRRIISFEEKSPAGGSGYINAGAYIFRKELFDDVSEDMAISLERELLPLFLERGVYGYISRGKFIDIGTPEMCAAAARFFEEDL